MRGDSGFKAFLLWAGHGFQADRVVGKDCMREGMGCKLIGGVGRGDMVQAT